MNKQEIKVLLEQATPGMTLTRAVSDNNGVVLVATGAELSEATLRSLHRFGVAVLWVAGAIPSTEETLAQEAAFRRKNSERHARLFRHTGIAPDDSYLAHLLVRYRGITPP